MNKIEAFQTSDGKLFSSQTMAAAHEDSLKMQPDIQAFIKSRFCKYNNVAHKKIVENTIIAWEQWKEIK